MLSANDLLRSDAKFYSGTGNASGVAAHVQLFNPAASGKTLYLTDAFVSVGGTVAVDIELRSYATALTNLSMQGIDFDLGGAAGVGAVRNVVSGALLGTQMGGWEMPVTHALHLVFRRPIVLAESTGVLLLKNENAPLLATFWWAER